tara:strand:+ start:5619 stop:5843 length:225 start_codon:yes stop_codon:yes gene_type:complete
MNVKALEVGTEEYRKYVYEDGKEILIVRPKTVFILEEGKHRVLAMDGWVTHIPSGWVLVKWLPCTGEPLCGIVA